MRANVLRQIAALFFLALSHCDVSAEVITLGHVKSSAIADRVDVYEDVSGKKVFSDILKLDSQGEFKASRASPAALDLGHSQSTWWVKMALHNDLDTAKEAFVELANSHLEEVNVYVVSSDQSLQKISTGNLKPFDTRPIANRNFVIPVLIEKSQKAHIFFEIKSATRLLIPLILRDRSEFDRHVKNDYLFQGFYIGSVLAIALFSIFYFVALKDVLYIKYLALLSLLTFTIFSLNGLVKEFFAFDSVAWSMHSAAVGAALVIAALLTFMRQFLALDQQLPWTDRVLKYITYAYPCLMISITLGPMQDFVQLGVVATLLVISLAMITSIRMVVLRKRHAYFFVVAYAAPFVTHFFNLLSMAKVIPQLWPVAESIQVAFLIEMVVIALALVDRTYQMRLQSEMDQNVIIDLQKQIVANLKEKEQALEGLLLKRFNELRHLIEMLSHEIRTPMSIIRMYIGMSSGDTKLKRHAVAAVADIDSVIERCVEIDQLDTGSIVVAHDACDVRAIVQDVCESRPEISRIRLNDVPVPLVTSDELLLIRIVSNLIDNALKYSPPDSTIDVYVGGHAEGSSNGIEVKVSNTAETTMTPDLNMMFEKYYRGAGAHAKTGSGLGLYLARTFADLLGATISCDYNNRQFTFKLWMPL